MKDNLTRTDSRLATLGSVLANWRDWNLPIKLAAVTLVPVIFAIVLGAMQIADQVDRASSYRQVDRLVQAKEELRVLVSALQRERTASAMLLAERYTDNATELRDERAAMDGARGEFFTATGRVRFGEEVTTARYRDVRAWLGELRDVRDQVSGSLIDASTVLSRYTRVIDALLRFDRALSAEMIDPGLVSSAAAQHELKTVSEQVQFQHALIGIGIVRGGLVGPDLEALRASLARFDDSVVSFRAVADVEYTRIFDQAVTDPVAAGRTNLAGAVAASQPGAGIPTTVVDWYASSEAAQNGIAEVAEQLARQVRARSAALQDEASDGAGVAAVILLVALVVAIAVMVVVGRHLVSSLSVLRRSALEVAEQRLPAAVARIRDHGAHGDSITLEPVPLTSMDEVGQVARAFDAVQSQALRLATEQAGLRAQFSSVFVNLSRRSQGLVQRQLHLLERLERDEEDADQLATLFQLDHLATRMRRNNENLMVLSGSDVSRRNQRPASLADLLRAAVSEIEQYQRVVMLPPPSVLVVGYAVGDLVRLTAELLDNATSFSAPDTSVTIASHSFEDGSVCVAVLDEGIGMNQEELDEANGKLADSASIDVSTSRRMGLFVIGRLAGRHGIEVRLNGGSEVTGVRATMTVPAELVAEPTESAGPGSVAPSSAATPPSPSPSPSNGLVPFSPSVNGHGGAVNGTHSPANGTGALPRRTRPVNGTDQPAEPAGDQPPTADRPGLSSASGAEPGATTDDPTDGPQPGIERTTGGAGTAEGRGSNNGTPPADRGTTDRTTGNGRRPGTERNGGSSRPDAGRSTGDRAGGAGTGGDRPDSGRSTGDDRRSGPDRTGAGRSTGDDRRPGTGRTAGSDRPNAGRAAGDDRRPGAGRNGATGAGRATAKGADRNGDAGVGRSDSAGAAGDERWSGVEGNGAGVGQSASGGAAGDERRSGVERTGAGPAAGDDRRSGAEWAGATGSGAGRAAGDDRWATTERIAGAVTPDTGRSGADRNGAAGSSAGRPGGDDRRPGTDRTAGRSAAGRAADTAARPAAEEHSAATRPATAPARSPLPRRSPSGRSGRDAAGGARSPIPFTTAGGLVSPADGLFSSSGRPGAGESMPPAGAPRAPRPYTRRTPAGGPPPPRPGSLFTPVGPPPPIAPRALDETTPIFDEMISAWFRAEPPATEPPPTESAGQPWRSDADAGFDAARAASRVEPAEFTETGLPRRSPRQNLVPGSIGAALPVPPSRQGKAAEDMRDRLSNYRNGVLRARDHKDTALTDWHFAADGGWRTANAVSAAKPVEFTPGGLPRRTPLDHLVPGSVPGGVPGSAPSGAADGQQPRAERAEELRGRLGSFQQGLSRGRRNLAERSAANGIRENKKQERE
ncbi:nitrate- and nitrite sensing domain-containing protein [Actinophytocola sediminis]